MKQPRMTTTSTNGEPNRSTRELLRDLSEQSRRLIAQEMALVRAEFTEKRVQAGLGVGLLVGAGILSLYGLGALTAGGILLLSSAMKAWVAAVTVAGGVLILAGAAALIGKTHLARAAPPVPQATIDTAKQDLETIRANVHEGRS